MYPRFLILDEWSSAEHLDPYIWFARAIGLKGLDGSVSLRSLKMDGWIKFGVAVHFLGSQCMTGHSSNQLDIFFKSMVSAVHAQCSYPLLHHRIIPLFWWCVIFLLKQWYLNGQSHFEQVSLAIDWCVLNKKSCTLFVVGGVQD